MLKFTLRTVSANSLDRLARRIGCATQIGERRKHLVLERSAWQRLALDWTFGDGKGTDFLAYF